MMAETSAVERENYTKVVSDGLYQLHQLYQGGDAENPLRASLDQLAAEVRKSHIWMNNPFHTVLCRIYTDF